MAILTINDLKELGTIMGVWAHPDDETFSMGGIMAAAAENGQAVICITATKGELGVQDEARWPQAQLADIREAELYDALKELGASQHYWLGYADGGCNSVDEEEATARIAELIQKHQPDSILTFGPDGMTGHPDHQTVSRWAGLARDKAGSQAGVFHAIQTAAQYKALMEADKALNIFFNIDKPDMREEPDCKICFRLPDEVFDKKIAALRAMPSQTERMLDRFSVALRDGLGTEAFTEAR